MERLPGRPLAENLYGVLPPEAPTVALYAIPVVPLGRDVVVIVSFGGSTLSEIVAADV